MRARGVALPLGTNCGSTDPQCIAEIWFEGDAAPEGETIDLSYTVSAATRAALQSSEVEVSVPIGHKGPLAFRGITLMLLATGAGVVALFGATFTVRALLRARRAAT